jgi:hypothetical protein
MNNPNFDIELSPIAKQRIWSDILCSLDKLIDGLTLYICYGIAILCGFKFIIYILNGFTSKSYMGATSLANPPLFH